LATSAEQKAQAFFADWQSESEDITAYTQSTKAKWPYVLIPYWEKRAFHLREATHTSQVTLAPLITSTSERDMQDWHRFISYITQNWVQEGRMIASERRADDHSIASVSEASVSEELATPSEIYQLDPLSQGQTPVTGTGPYAPFWQTSPPPTREQIGRINLDLLSQNTTRGLYDALLSQVQIHQEQMHLEHIMVLSDISPDVSRIYLGSDSNDTTTIQTLLLQPIYDSFAKDRQMTGFLLGLVDWDSLMNNVMPPDSTQSGMMCVLENTCGSSATYQTASGDQQNDEATTLLLPGQTGQSLIKNKHKAMGVTVSFGPHSSEPTAFYHSTFNSTSTSTFDDTTCHYSFHFYPSQTMQDSYISNTPKYASVLLAMVLATFGIVFAVYVHLMRQQHNQIQKLAIKASTVISSLFPSTVRDRIMEDTLNHQNKKHKKQKHMTSVEAIAEQKQQQSLLSDRAMTDESNMSHDRSSVFEKLTTTIKPTNKGSNVYSTKPIAGTFDCCLCTVVTISARLNPILLI
jgi:hypothetical protein